MRQKRILAFLLVGLLAAMIYAWLDTPVQQRVTPGEKRGSAAREPGRGGEVRPLRRLIFETGVETDDREVAVKRDVFNFYVPPPKPAPKPVVQKPQPVVPTVEMIPVPPPLPEVRPVAPPPPRTSFKLIGQLVKEERTTVFLSQGGELFVVRVGESFGPEMRFRAEEIREGQLLIREAGFDEPIRVQLAKEKAGDGSPGK